jgi:DnaK suppressor protein
MGNVMNPELARRALLRKREALLQRRAETLADEQELLTAAETETLDIAADRTAAHVLERLSEAELAQLGRIARALARLDGGVYGECVVCHEAIPAERLRIVPEADRCATCSNSH